MITESPWLLVDFDGVLNADEPMSEARAMARHELGWRTGLASLDGGPERVCCNSRHGQMLAGLARETGARLAWATLREPVATTRCAPLAGLPPMPVVPVSDAIWRGEASTKAESVIPWTAGTPFAWFEDRGDECEEADRLAGSQPHLMIQVDPRYGLGEEHIAEAREWLASLREGAPS